MLNANPQPYQQPRPLGQDYRRSASNEMAKALALIYGRQRVGCEFISDVFDILTQAISGGKGAPTEGYNYYASFLVAVGHGPMLSLQDVYFNGDPVFTNNTPIYPVSLTVTYNPATGENVATWQSQNPHGLTTGQTIVVYYALQDYFNGEFLITVVSPTQFQYVIPGAELNATTAAAVGGQVIYAYVKLDPIYANGADSTEFTIPDFGTATIYWGTQTQTADAYTAEASGVQHPPYLGICYIVFRQLYLGFNQTNVQNIEVVVERAPTFPGMSVPANADLNGDCNPACIAADLILSPVYGLAANPATDFDAATFDQCANQFFNENVAFSPILNRPDEVLSTLTDILSMVDAAVTLDANGLLALMMQRELNAGVTEIDDDVLVELPNFTPEDWSSVVNQTYLNYLDRDAGWQPDYVTWQDSAGIYAKERADPQSIDKDFITNRILATKLCAIAGQLAALPKQDGKLTIAFDLETFLALAPGAGIDFGSDFRPALAGNYRVTSRSMDDPSKPYFEVEVSIDRSYLYTTTAATQSYAPAVQGGDGSIKTGQPPSPENPVPELQPIPAPTPSAIIELPECLWAAYPAWTNNFQLSVAVLVSRNTQATTYATLYLGRNYVFSGLPPSSYEELATITGFAMYGQLVAAVAANAAYMAIGNPPPVEGQKPNPLPVVCGLQIQLAGVDLILPDVCDFDALANEVLLFVDQEIMSIAEANMTAEGAYTLTVIRGRFGTAIANHAAGATMWIIPLAQVKAIAHPHFALGNVAQFKLTIGLQSISDVQSFNLGFGALIGPGGNVIIGPGGNPIIPVNPKE
jgi:hypothetical protein